MPQWVDTPLKKTHKSAGIFQGNTAGLSTLPKFLHVLIRLISCKNAANRQVRVGQSLHLKESISFCKNKSWMLFGRTVGLIGSLTQRFQGYNICSRTSPASCRSWEQGQCLQIYGWSIFYWTLHSFEKKRAKVVNTSLLNATSRMITSPRVGNP